MLAKCMINENIVTNIIMSRDYMLKKKVSQAISLNYRNTLAKN